MSKNDQSFADIAGKFNRNIYGTPKGQLRLAVLKRDLSSLARSETQLNILDVGAGLGQISELFAKAGHSITHSDVAEPMLEQAQQRHREAGLASQYRYRLASLQELACEPQQYDLVLCHAVLEWLAKPHEAIAQLTQLTKPQGRISLMFYNRDAKRLANILYGNFDYVQNDLQVKKRVRLSPQQPLAPAEVESWIQAEGLVIEQQTGVRCFYDYLKTPPPAEQMPQLLELELAYNQQSPYRELGRYQHWLMRKP
ncbi:methyltransferase domain-containing protein [Pseudidiomarina taiwanensis]|uniref:tRNA 5-carboxymethoxyuridine methyltransferase n=1 Tax=Pseudidiomarina taiwanensis TaxID=337250 RepID=A0A432ZN08_9GAMM|nr:methyltransferase domain-containing protein [Pseudidiomarina taiwanensis]RUO79260.1 SAM-dependent methyltransferase [Pseudidiomarina taiwanensis]